MTKVRNNIYLFNLFKVGIISSFKVNQNNTLQILIKSFLIITSYIKLIASLT